MLFMQYVKEADSQINETQFEECIHTEECISRNEYTTEQNLTQGDSRPKEFTTSKLAEDTLTDKTS